MSAKKKLVLDTTWKFLITVAIVFQLFGISQLKDYYRVLSDLPSLYQRQKETEKQVQEILEVLKRNKLAFDDLNEKPISTAVYNYE